MGGEAAHVFRLDFIQMVCLGGTFAFILLGAAFAVKRLTRLINGMEALESNYQKDRQLAEHRDVQDEAV